MRIGILTLPLHTNYGGILQAYALQTVLERMGHEVMVIDRKRTVKTTWRRDVVSYPYRAFKKFILNKKCKIRWEVSYRNEQSMQMSNIQKFIDKNLHVFHVEDLEDIDEKLFDAIVVGSDQIWRKQYYCTSVNSDISTAFLSFTKRWSLKRIAFSASFGVDDWEYSVEETKRCSEAANLFDSISVRELSAVMLCENHLHRKAVCTLDPTFLLSELDYVQLLDKGNMNNEKRQKQLFVYVLDKTDEKNMLVEKIAKDKDLKVSEFNTTSKDSECGKPCKTVESWIDGIRNSELIVTDSFHACVFSIILHKPFLAVINNGRGASRFNTLISLLGVGENIISDTTMYDETKSYEVNDLAYNNLNILRTQSLDYIKNSLMK